MNAAAHNLLFAALLCLSLAAPTFVSCRSEPASAEEPAEPTDDDAGGPSEQADPDEACRHALDGEWSGRGVTGTIDGENLVATIVYRGQTYVVPAALLDCSMPSAQVFALGYTVNIRFDDGSAEFGVAKLGKVHLRKAE